MRRSRPIPPGVNGVVGMDVVEINRPGGDPPDEDTAKQRGPQFGLNIRLTSPGGDIRVVGRGLNVEMRVNAQVTGTIAQPILTGNASVVRGDYEFAGKRFVFDDRGTVALSTDPALIRLNLSATRDDPTLTATVKVTGTAAAPKIELTSTPSLPQDEILSQVLFGRSASQLSGFEAAQLASGVASLAGGGGFDVIGNLRELAGLDRLSFGGEASALTVAGGRYITDNVYLEIIGGGEGGAAVNVEWQVRRSLAISSKIGGTGDATLSIRWRRQSRNPARGRTAGRTGTDPAMTLLDRLGVRLPIFQAPMAGVSTPEMAAAVSNAGGLGGIAVGATDAAGAAIMIDAVRARTDRPFNVNVFVHATPVADAAREAAWLGALSPLFAEFGAEPPSSLRTIYQSFADDDAMQALLIEAAPAVVSFHFGLPARKQSRR
jgi:hypothetical protein